MMRFLHDLRFASRALRKSPGFTAIAVASLGLGIGANTAIFSLIHAVFQRTLPVDRPQDLAVLTDPTSSGLMEDSSESGERSLLSWKEFEALRQSNEVFSGMFAAESNPSLVDAQVDRARLKIHEQLASGEFFQVLGVQPEAGRFFTPEEERPDAATAVAVISHSFWQRQFASDGNAIGRTLLIGRGSFRIIGIAPPNFRGVVIGTEVDAWLPMAAEPNVFPGHDYLTPRDTLWLQAIGRLKPGVSRATAQAGVNVAFQQVLQSWEPSMPPEQDRKRLFDQKIVLKSGEYGVSFVRGDFGDPLIMLMAMVGVVLLIACANVANLSLARATGRQRELGVRMALGARRGALIRQMLTESVLVAIGGGIAGSLLAIWGGDLVISLANHDASVVLDGRQDPTVFLFTAAASLLTVVLFGLMPAVRATRLDVNRLLSAGMRGAIGARGQARGGRILVAVQIALSLLLLVGATLLVRTLNHLAKQDLGFDRDHMLQAFIDPLGAGYHGASQEAMTRRLAERMRAIPGVRGVAVSQNGLFAGDAGDHLDIEGVTGFKPDDMHSRWSLVAAGYFKAMGIPVVRGRELTEADEVRRAPLCLINESFARFYFKNTDPIGKHITDTYPTTITTYEIVGVVADAQEHELRQRHRPRFFGNFFFPIGETRRFVVVLRTDRDPALLVNAVTQTVNQFDPALPPPVVRTINQQIGRRLIAESLMARLAASFGVLALLMAAIGIYGVMSYAIGRRTSEIGLRMALGASQGGVMGMVLRETATLLLAGTVIGLPAAIFAARLMRTTLAGVGPADPVSIAAALGIIATATLLAGYIPARRASRIDPMDALRCE
jgi:predicted permease